jgi:hypothetical protein
MMVRHNLQNLLSSYEIERLGWELIGYVETSMGDNPLMLIDRRSRILYPRSLTRSLLFWSLYPYI